MWRWDTTCAFTSKRIHGNWCYILHFQKIIATIKWSVWTINTGKFVWIPSHVGLRHNATADRLAKEACCLPPRGDDCPLSLPCYISRIRSASVLPVGCRRDAERSQSITIQHYELVCRQKYTYRCWSLMIRRHNVVSARLRLAYRPPWQVAGVDG